MGRLAEDTGVLLYLAAVKELVTTGQKVSLDVYGDGPLRSECQKVANDMKTVISLKGVQKITTAIYQKYSMAFVSGYLSILEALSAGVNVVAVTNQAAEIKSDYLYLTPFANWITIANSAEEVAAAVLKQKPLSIEAKKWAQQQTWKKLAVTYQQLWKKHA